MGARKAKKPEGASASKGKKQVPKPEFVEKPVEVSDTDHEIGFNKNKDLDKVSVSKKDDNENGVSNVKTAVSENERYSTTMKTASDKSLADVTPPKKKRVKVDYSSRGSSGNEYISYVNKTPSGILFIYFCDKKNTFTWMEDMERKSFLEDANMHFAKNFKARNKEGKVLNKKQTIGVTGKSPRGATGFIHIMPDEEEYSKDEEKYLRKVIEHLVETMNAHVEKRSVQFEKILFKTSLSPFVETMTTESLSKFLFQEDALELFSFVYDKEIPEYSNIEQLLKDFPHIPTEFLGSDSKGNIELLMKVH